MTSSKPSYIKEVVDTVLPEIVLPYWTYNRENQADRKLGEKIWQKVNPSLRNLQSLLETASQMARDEELPAITEAIIEEAYLWMLTQQEQYAASAQARDSTAEAAGEHERKSEERHQAKRGKRTTND